MACRSAFGSALSSSPRFLRCELGITENTVKLYVSQVLRLTHMHNRTQLALALSPSTSVMRVSLRTDLH